MFEERHIPNRRAGEKLITFVRPHWFHLLKSILFFIVLFVIPFVLFFLLKETMGFVFENEITFTLLALTGTLYLMVAYLILYNNFIDYHLDIWIVTNFRIIAIEQTNIFNRTVSEHKIELIQDVSANQTGLLQTFLNFGDVEVQTAGEEQRFHFNDVPDPFTVAKKINKLHSKVIKNG